LLKILDESSNHQNTAKSDEDKRVYADADIYLATHSAKSNI